MRQWMGQTVLTCRRNPGIRRRSQYLPRYGERQLVLDRGRKWYRLHWVAHAGYRVLGAGPPDLPAPLYIEVDAHPQKGVRMKRRAPVSENIPGPALAAESKVLDKLPKIREFLSAVKYDDGSVRQPGYVTIRNRTWSYEITLYDPDAGLRVAVRAPTLDDVWAAAELILEADDAPWEIDQYLQSQLSRGKKKRA